MITDKSYKESGHGRVVLIRHIRIYLWPVTSPCRGSGSALIRVYLWPVTLQTPTASRALTLEAVIMSSTVLGLLFFLFVQEAALMQVLAAHAMSRPRHCFEPLLRHRLAAANALSIAAVVHPHQRLVDQV